MPRAKGTRYEKLMAQHIFKLIFYKLTAKTYKEMYTTLILNFNDT
jgi:hypothetical protein